MKKRKVTNNGLKRKKIIRETVIAAGLVALFWAWMLHTTRPATEGNTYRCQGKIADVVVDQDVHSHGPDTYKLFVYLEGDCYLVDMQTSEAKAQALAQELEAEEEIMTLTVWKRPLKYIFDYMYYHPKNQLVTLQVVEVSCGPEVLWPLENHNAHQHQQRIAGYIAGAIITILVGGWEFWKWKSFYPRRNKKTQKRSEML